MDKNAITSGIEEWSWLAAKKQAPSCYKKLNYSNNNVFLIEFYPELPDENSAWSTSWFQSDNILSREPTNGSLNYWPIDCELISEHCSKSSNLWQFVM